jgi:hypothetical protein
VAESAGLPLRSPAESNAVGGAFTTLSVLRSAGTLQLHWDSRNEDSDMQLAKALAQDIEALVPTLGAMKETAYP